MTVRAVVFDYFGTLAPSRSEDAYRTGRAEVARVLGVDPALFHATLSGTARERFAGAGGSLEGSMRWLAGRLGLDPAPELVTRAAATRLEIERGMGQPRPEAPGVLRAIRDRGLPIGLVSDCSAELPLYFPDLPVAPYIDIPVFSFVTGHCKPAPENYLACAAGLGVDPAECLYVGDGGSNELAGARAVGMRPVHLAIAAESDALVYGRHTSWYGERVTSLPEVLDLL